MVQMPSQVSPGTNVTMPFEPTLVASKLFVDQRLSHLHWNLKDCSTKILFTKQIPLTSQATPTANVINAMLYLNNADDQDSFDARSDELQQLTNFLTAEFEGRPDSENNFNKPGEEPPIFVVVNKTRELTEEEFTQLIQFYIV